MSKLRILLADDHQLLLEKVASLLEQTFNVVGRVGDGQSLFEAAMRLKPDVIITDISMPILSGIEAVSKLKESGCTSKVVFLTVHTDPDFVLGCLVTGALGYVVKRRMATDLLPAIEAVLAGRRFVTSDLKGDEFGEGSYAQASHRHEVQFYSDDAVFLDSFTHFIVVALKAGNPAIAIMTKSHCDALVQRLKAQGVDVDAAIQQGTYIPVDAADTLSKIMVNGLPDPVRFFEVARTLIETARKASKGGPGCHLAACGECAPLLWMDGKVDAAIRLEHLWDQVAKTFGLHILCGYASASFENEADNPAYQSICAEHSAVYSC